MDIRTAIEALSSIPLEDPSSVYGPVASLIKPTQEKFITAIENTAGNRLFHVVVSNDQVGSTIIQYCQQNQLGRITVLPVEQIRSMINNPEFPDDSRCFPLLHCMKYPEEVKPIMVSIFGNTLLCENLQSATEIAEKYNMNCITLAGEKVSKRGAMRGGYSDSRSSRYRLYHSIHEKQDTVGRMSEREE